MPSQRIYGDMFRPGKLASLLVVVVFSVSVSLAMAQASGGIPHLEGDSLSGHHVVLPDVAAGKVAVLILGFTRASKGPTSAWSKQLFADYGQQAGVAIYQLPVLQEVPRLIRSFVISGMRKDVPQSLQDHFVPILSGEAELKKTVGYKEPDDAYMILLDKSGKIAQQQHGVFKDADYAQFRKLLDSEVNAQR
jgi:hypothetical protein